MLSNCPVLALFDCVVNYCFFELMNVMMMTMMMMMVV